MAKITLKPDFRPAQLDRAIRYIRDLGNEPIVLGDGRTILGICEGPLGRSADAPDITENLESINMKEQPFPLASREFQKEDTIVEIKGVRIGGGYLAMIAGPCVIESEAVLMKIAEGVHAAGANILRGGAFKPRSSPYSFQGLGPDALKMLEAAGERFAMPVVTEVMDPRQIELVVRHVDILQIGARNMQNFELLKEVGRSRSPVLLKRGMSATVRDLLMAAEYVLSEGNRRVILCERGVRSFEDSTRNMLDLTAVPNVKRQSHLPIIIDPSHATGRPELIPAMSRAGITAGADGVHIEVHCCPDEALSDGPQALLPAQYSRLMDDIRRLVEFHGLTIDGGTQDHPRDRAPVVVEMTRRPDGPEAMHLAARH